MKKLLFASVLFSFLFFLIKRDFLDLSRVRQVIESVVVADKVSDVSRIQVNFDTLNAHKIQQNGQSIDYVNALLSEFNVSEILAAQKTFSYLDLMVVFGKLNALDEGCTSPAFQFELNDIRAKVSSLLSESFFLP